VNDILPKKGNDTSEQREEGSEKHGGKMALPSKAQEALYHEEKKKKKQKNNVPLCLFLW
jgi:hypothetical protein